MLGFEAYFGIPILLVLTAIGVAIYFAEGAVHVWADRRVPPDESQADVLAAAVDCGWESAHVITADGYRLDGWLFLPSKPNGEAAVVLHGFTDTRTGVLAHVRMMLEEGFAVLCYDSRAHGVSEGSEVGFGAREVDDLRIWSGWLRRRLDADGFLGIGMSMGAAVLLRALADPNVPLRACVAESSYARFEEVAVVRIAFRLGWPVEAARVLMNIVGPLAYRYLELRYGIDLRRPAPIETLAAARVPVLLIHGTTDKTIPLDHSRRLHAANPRWTDLWEVPGAAHTEPIEVAPHDYASRVSQWLLRVETAARR